jgi:putative membrane protein
MTVFLINNVALAAGNGGFFTQVFVMMLGVFAAAYVLKSDVKTGSIGNVFILAIVLIILNKTIGAILHTLAYPFEVVSLGVVSFLVDALIIQLAAYFFTKFRLKSFWTAVWMAVIISLVTVVVEWVF